MRVNTRAAHLQARRADHDEVGGLPGRGELNKYFELINYSLTIIGIRKIR